MSNFLRKGKREKLKADKKEVKSRTKEIYRILNELDVVAKDIHENEDKDLKLNENNIKDIASKYTERTIGGFETMILLGKLNEVGRVNKEEVLKDENKS